MSDDNNDDDDDDDDGNNGSVGESSVTAALFLESVPRG